MKNHAPSLGTHEVNSSLYLASSNFLRKLKIDELTLKARHALNRKSQNKEDRSNRRISLLERMEEHLGSCDDNAGPFFLTTTADATPTSKSTAPVVRASRAA